MIRGSQRNDFWGELRALERFGMNSTLVKVDGATPLPIGGDL